MSSNTNRIPRLDTHEYIPNTQFIMDIDFVFEGASLYNTATDFTIKIEWCKLGLSELYTKDTEPHISVFDLPGELGVKLILRIPESVTNDWPNHKTDGLISIFRGETSLDPLAIGRIEPAKVYR